MFCKNLQTDNWKLFFNKISYMVTVKCLSINTCIKPICHLARQQNCKCDKKRVFSTKILNCSFLSILQIPDVPKRDRLAFELAEKASKQHRDKKETALRLASRLARYNN